MNYLREIWNRLLLRDLPQGKPLSDEERLRRGLDYTGGQELWGGSGKQDL